MLGSAMQLHFETRRSGLTLVELLVAMLSASVLVLTMGAVLYYGIRGWSSTSEVAELQRDGAFAVDMLSRTVQASSYHEISVDARPGISFITNHVRNTPAAFYLDADGALVYDPDTTAGGAQDLVPPGRGFNCRNRSRGSVQSNL